MQQFKDKDWLRVIAGHERPINSVFQIKSCLTRYKLSDVELWQPKEGEWCCFHNGKEQFTVAKFQNHTDNTDTHFKLVSCYGKWTEIFKYCEPFTGKLPTFLQH